MKTKVEDFYKGLLKENEKMKKKDKKIKRDIIVGSILMGVAYIAGHAKGFEKGDLSGQAKGYCKAFGDIAKYFEK